MMLDIQSEMVELLEADPYFVDIPIFTQRKKDIENEIANALGVVTEKGGKIGVCIVAIVPLARCDHPNLPGPEFDAVPQVLRVLENVTLNTTGKAAEDVVEKVVATLHGRQLYSAGVSLRADKPGIALGDDPDNLSYDAFFVTHGVLSYGPAQVARPGIAIVGGQVTALSCETADVAICTTVDGTRPTLTNKVDLVLPYNIASGVKVLARAYKDGMRASEIVEQVA